MGFRQGDGDEKLLTCIACSKPMSIDAEFCSECGAKRSVATGYEVNASVETSILSQEIKEIKKAKVAREPRVRNFIRIRSTSFGALLLKYTNIVKATGLVIFFAAGFVITQTVIFSSQSTDSFAKDYISMVASRDISQITQNSKYFPNPKNLPVLPTKYQQWSEAEQLTWRTNSSWNGWLGTAKIEFIPTSLLSAGKKSLLLEAKAKYIKKWWIFREIEWEASKSIASVKLNAKFEENQTLHLNGIMAGNSTFPALKEPEYAVLPGPFKLVSSGIGFTKERVFETFSNTNGTVTSYFGDLEYGLSIAQTRSAQNQVEANLNSCLKSKCSRLPKLSVIDFDFSNWPSSYLYVDYFNTAWAESSSCDVATYEVKSFNNAYLSMKCSVYAAAGIKWILYRIFFTTYYDTGRSNKTIDLTLSADLTPISNSSGVNVNNIRISG